MTELIFATHNDNKAKEIEALLPAGFKVLSLRDINWHEEIVEDGDTLEANALLKSKAVWEATGRAVFADDTGLQVNALGGRPGVHSARYAGEPRNNEANKAKLLQELSTKEDRSAAFRTVISYVDSEGQFHAFEGNIAGEILMSEQGSGGFGYDPLFRPEGFEKSFAEMSMDEKGEISHRARAFRAFISYLESL